MSSNLPEALEVYRAERFLLTKTEISIEEIGAQETGLGLTGSGNGCLTKLLETLFGCSSTLRCISKNLFENKERAQLYLRLQKLYI